MEVDWREEVKTEADYLIEKLAGRLPALVRGLKSNKAEHKNWSYVGFMNNIQQTLEPLSDEQRSLIGDSGVELREESLSEYLERMNKEQQ